MGRSAHRAVQRSRVRRACVGHPHDGGVGRRRYDALGAAVLVPRSVRRGQRSLVPVRRVVVCGDCCDGAWHIGGGARRRRVRERCFGDSGFVCEWRQPLGGVPVMQWRQASDGVSARGRRSRQAHSGREGALYVWQRCECHRAVYVAVQHWSHEDWLPAQRAAERAV